MTEPGAPLSSTQPAMGFALALDAATKRVFSAYTVDVTEPAASAGKDVQTVRHIRLVPKNGDQALVIGSVSPGAKKAELRTLGFTLALSKRRFGRELPIPPLEYLRFVEIARGMLEERGITVTVVACSTTLPETHEPAPPRASTLPYIAVIAASASTLTLIASQIAR